MDSELLTIHVAGTGVSISCMIISAGIRSAQKKEDEGVSDLVPQLDFHIYHQTTEVRVAFPVGRFAFV